MLQLQLNRSSSCCSSWSCCKSKIGVVVRVKLRLTLTTTPIVRVVVRIRPGVDLRSTPGLILTTTLTWAGVLAPQDLRSTPAQV